MTQLVKQCLVFSCTISSLQRMCRGVWHVRPTTQRTCGCKWQAGHNVFCAPAEHDAPRVACKCCARSKNIMFTSRSASYLGINRCVSEVHVSGRVCECLCVCVCVYMGEMRDWGDRPCLCVLVYISVPIFVNYLPCRHSAPSWNKISAYTQSCGRPGERVVTVLGV